MPKPRRMFPTRHPLVQNPDGSSSNVRTMTAGMDGRHYVLPTMVDGKQLEEEEAIEVARRVGLGQYPSFATGEKALDYSERMHGSQPAEGGVGLDDPRLMGLRRMSRGRR